MSEVGRVSVGIEAVTTGFEQGMNRVSTQMQAVAKKMESIGKNMTKYVTLPIMGMATLGLHSAMELEASKAKFETVFGEYTDIADGFIEKFKELTPATTAEARNMASGIQDLLVPLGFMREEATQMTSEFMHVTGALANFNNGTHSAEQVSRAMQGAITGQYESLKALGIQLDVGVVKQKAVEMGLASTTNEVTKQDMAQVALAEIYRQSTDALDAYTEENLDAKTKLGLLKAEALDMAGTFGEVMLPVLLEVVEGLKAFVGWLNGLSDGQKKAVVAIGLILAAIGPLLIMIAKVITAITEIKIAFMKVKVFLLPAFAKIKTAFAVMAGAITAKIALILGAVALVIAIVVVVIKNWEKIKEFFVNLWQSVVDIFNGAVEKVKGIIQNMKDWITNTFNALVDGVKNIFSKVTDFITAPFKKAWKGVSKIADNIKGALNKINPFSKSSPSLVEYVEMGVAKITTEYESLNDMDIPSVSQNLGGEISVPETPKAQSKNLGANLNDLYLTVLDGSTLKSLQRKLSEVSLSERARGATA